MPPNTGSTYPERLAILTSELSLVPSTDSSRDTSGPEESTILSKSIVGDADVSADPTGACAGRPDCDYRSSRGGHRWETSMDAGCLLVRARRSGWR